MKTIIKKSLSFFLVMGMSVTLIACGSTTKAPETTTGAPESTTQTTDTLNAEKNLLSVELTIPSSLLEDDAAVLDEEAKAAGVKEITQNDDGSITMKMSKSAHKKLLDEFKVGIDEGITEILNDKETYPSLTEITYNDDLTEFTVKVDSNTYGGFEGLSALALYISGNVYQALNATPEDQIKTIVNFVDKDTGEIIETGDSSEMNNSEN